MDISLQYALDGCHPMNMMHFTGKFPASFLCIISVHTKLFLESTMHHHLSLLSTPVLVTILLLFCRTNNMLIINNNTLYPDCAKFLPRTPTDRLLVM